MELVDTHAHLADEQFAADADAVLERAQSHNVSLIVAIGIDVETSRQAIELARRTPLIRASVGIHPNYANAARAGNWDEIAELARESEVVAIGETGLDRFRSDTPFDQQIDYFERHLALAESLKLPVVIHSRDADNDVISVLERQATRCATIRGVMHSFTGSAATAARCLELGLHISFAGQITFANRKFDALREVAKFVPDDRLLVETDSPYLAPEPHRGRRNEPAYVRLTSERLALLRGTGINEIGALTSANARLLFRRASG
jgi:TatD DNase family protein